MTREIPLSRGMVALVDDEDYEKLNKYKWTALFCKWEIIYAVRSENNSSVLMHRQILDAHKGITVDHINHNGLDNRRENIRLATVSENNMNRGKTKKNKSGYKGAYFDKRKRKYRTTIRKNNRTIHIGYFDTAIEAARAYDNAVKQHFGEFSMPNQYKDE